MGARLDLQRQDWSSRVDLSEWRKRTLPPLGVTVYWCKTTSDCCAMEIKQMLLLHLFLENICNFSVENTSHVKLNHPNWTCKDVIVHFLCLKNDELEVCVYSWAIYHHPEITLHWQAVVSQALFRHIVTTDRHVMLQIALSELLCKLFQVKMIITHVWQPFLVPPQSCCLGDKYLDERFV